jgi:predicted PurR-regulated permease PerM
LPSKESIFTRNKALIFTVIAFAIVFCAFYILRGIIFPFVVGLIIAYLVHPLIIWIESKLPYRGHYLSTKRISLIVLIFVVVLVVVGLFIFYMVTAVSDSFMKLIYNAPNYITRGLGYLTDWFESFRYLLPGGWQVEIDQYIQEIGTRIGGAIKSSFLNALGFLPTTINFLLGLVSLPIFLFFILKDSKKLHDGFYALIPSALSVHTKNIVSLIDLIIGRYIRAQLFLGLAVGCLVFIGLLILGIPLAPALAVLAGLTELIPVLGPWIGGAVGVIITLATVPEKTIWVAIVYIAVQQLENAFLVPRIQGGILHINPAVLIVLIVIGAYLAGIWGIILIAPLTATLVAIYNYIRQNVKTAENAYETVQNELQ